MTALIRLLDENDGTRASAWNGFRRTVHRERFDIRDWRLTRNDTDETKKAKAEITRPNATLRSTDCGPRKMICIIHICHAHRGNGGGVAAEDDKIANWLVTEVDDCHVASTVLLEYAVGIPPHALDTEAVCRLRIVRIRRNNRAFLIDP